VRPKKPEVRGNLPRGGFRRMSESPRPVPSYRRHKSSGQAVVTLPDGTGRRRDIMLGRYGTKASRVEYARVVAEWEARGRRLLVPAAKADLTINELLVRFLHHADKHYRRPDGSPTTEVVNFKLAFRPLKKLYGHTRAADFGPLSLKAVRQAMVDGELCRNVVNARTGRIKRMFKWAASEELVPQSVHGALSTVVGLARGRTRARETEPIQPVADSWVDAIQAHVLPEVWGMIEIQRVTGMRPGEVVTIRGCDIEMGGKVWTYRPPQHKTAWRGRGRVICLGQKAQAIVRDFLTTDIQSPLFSPARALAARAVTMRASRKTPVQPSQRNRRKRRPRKVPGFVYQRESYSKAILKGCDKADQARRQEVENRVAEAEVREPVKVSATVDTSERLVPRWHPNQLRHNFGTDVRRGFGLEAAQVVLGHSRADVTQVYAERDLSLAEKVALEVG
jgi:integrase